jgi:hypothetical protein
MPWEEAGELKSKETLVFSACHRQVGMDGMEEEVNSKTEYYPISFLLLLFPFLWGLFYIACIICNFFLYLFPNGELRSL